MADKNEDTQGFEEELEDEEGEDTGVGNGADGKDRKSKDDKGGDEEDRGKRQRPNRRDRNTERLYGKMTSIEKGLGVLPELLSRLERLESGQGDLRKASDPKPKFSDFDTPEEYETAYEKWVDRNPKTPAKDDDKDKGKDKGKGNDRNDTQDPEPEEIAKALGITLEVYEDFTEHVDAAREEHEDYDEVMAEAKTLLASAPKLARELIEFGEYEGATGPLITYHLLKDREGRKEFKRIAALGKRDMLKALEAVAEDLGETPEADRKDSRDDKKDKGERRFTPLQGRRAPSQKKRDESTMSDEDFFAEEEKKAGHR